jgi:hypothetical protein
MRTTRRKIAVALVAFVLAPLLMASKCGTGAPAEPAHGNPADPPKQPDAGAVPTPVAGPKDWPVGGYEFWGMAITVWVEASCLPMYVTVDATDTTTGEHINVVSSDTELGLKVNYPYWSVPLAYPAHHGITVTVHVKASKPSERGYIAVREGDRPYARSTDFNGAAATAIEYQNQRR